MIFIELLILVAWTVVLKALINTQWCVKASIVTYCWSGCTVRFPLGITLPHPVKGFYNIETDSHIVASIGCAQDLGMFLDSLEHGLWSSCAKKWQKMKPSMVGKIIYTKISLWELLIGVDTLPVVYRNSTLEKDRQHAV
jgi:hypothetical protein